MLHKRITSAAFAFAFISSTGAAQGSPLAHSGTHGGGHSPTQPHLHVNPRWDECSFQLNAALTKSAWRQFALEAGLVTYFRSLNDAKPMGKGKFEVSVLQWTTGIDDSDTAWNDTFVHPDSTHYLFEGSGLSFPGLMLRAGVGDRTDIGVYATKNPNANYGFFGGQVQRNVVNNAKHSLAAAARLSFVSMYGPDDLDFSVIGADFVASWEKRLTGWMSVSPYLGVSSYLSRAHEQSSVVDLDDAIVGGSQAMIGAALNVSVLRLAAEYSSASVNSVSFKIGVGK